LDGQTDMTKPTFAFTQLCAGTLNTMQTIRKTVYNSQSKRVSVIHHAARLYGSKRFKAKL